MHSKFVPFQTPFSIHLLTVEPWVDWFMHRYIGSTDISKQNNDTTMLDRVIRSKIIANDKTIDDLVSTGDSRSSSYCDSRSCIVDSSTDEFDGPSSHNKECWENVRLRSLTILYNSWSMIAKWMCLTIVRRFIPNEPPSHKKVIRNDVRSTVAINNDCESQS